MCAQLIRLLWFSLALYKEFVPAVSSWNKRGKGFPTLHTTDGIIAVHGVTRYVHLLTQLWCSPVIYIAHAARQKHCEAIK
jgi:hypothetical protein